MRPAFRPRRRKFNVYRISEHAMLVVVAVTLAVWAVLMTTFPPF